MIAAWLPGAALASRDGDDVCWACLSCSWCVAVCWRARRRRSVPGRTGRCGLLGVMRWSSGRGAGLRRRCSAAAFDVRGGRRPTGAAAVATWPGSPGSTCGSTWAWTAISLPLVVLTALLTFLCFVYLCWGDADGPGQLLRPRPAATGPGRWCSRCSCSKWA